MKKNIFQNPSDYSSFCLSSGVGMIYFISEEKHMSALLPFTHRGQGEKGSVKL